MSRPIYCNRQSEPASDHAPFLLSRSRIYFPKAQPTKKGVFIASALNAVGQVVEAVHVAAAQDDIVGDERFFQLHDGENHLAFPFLLAESFNSRDAEKIFDDVVVAIRQVAELERQQGFFPDQGGTETGAEAEEK